MHHERTEEEKRLFFFQETFSDLFFSWKKGIFSVVDPINHSLLKFGRNASLSKTWHTKKENFETLAFYSQENPAATEVEVEEIEESPKK